jgi:hypothetical protein
LCIVGLETFITSSLCAKSRRQQGSWPAPQIKRNAIGEDISRKGGGIAKHGARAEDLGTLGLGAALAKIERKSGPGPGRGKRGVQGHPVFKAFVEDIGLECQPYISTPNPAKRRRVFFVCV